MAINETNETFSAPNGPHTLKAGAYGKKVCIGGIERVDRSYDGSRHLDLWREIKDQTVSDIPPNHPMKRHCASLEQMVEKGWIVD